MKINKPIYENPITYLVLILIGLGIVMLYSASSTIAYNKFNEYSFFLNKHLVRIFISGIAFLFMYNLPYRYLKQSAFGLLIISWIFLISAYFFNEGSSTRRWLIIYGHNIITTSDFAKISLIIFTAYFIDKNKKLINNLKLLCTEYIPYLIVTLALIFFQPDLSTTFAILIIITTMLIIGGLKIHYLFFPLITLLIAISFKIKMYQYERFLEWREGVNNYQVINSLQALANGSFWGVGIGKSIIKDGYMPEVHTDFILPIIGEELGFVGIIVIFILFLVLYFNGIKICKLSPDIFSSMLSLGITINITYYFLINASYVVGILPTTGLPIPFISYGGSHTLFTLISIGILLNISRNINIYKYRNIT